MKHNDAWSLYWQGGHQESCIANNSTEDQFILSDIWQEFAVSLAHNSAVLDLATGNGSVPHNLLSFNELLQITAVDRADINPQKHIEKNSLLQKVMFMPNIDITHLPFNENTFDAITSQFGLEYSALNLSTSELIRVLKPQGHFLFIMHHKDSEVVVPARAKVQEFELLFDSGILEGFEAFLNGGINLQQLNTLGEKVLAEHTMSKSEAITGQIFAAIDKLIQMKEQGKDIAELIKIYTTMKSRIIAEMSRLKQLISASLSKVDVTALCSSLEGMGVNVVFSTIDLPQERGVLGWKIKGTKL